MVVVLSRQLRIIEVRDKDVWATLSVWTIGHRYAPLTTSASSGNVGGVDAESAAFLARRGDEVLLAGIRGVGT